MFADSDNARNPSSPLQRGRNESRGFSRLPLLAWLLSVLPLGTFILLGQSLAHKEAFSLSAIIVPPFTLILLLPLALIVTLVSKPPVRIAMFVTLSLLSALLLAFSLFPLFPLN